MWELSEANTKLLLCSSSVCVLAVCGDGTASREGELDILSLPLGIVLFALGLGLKKRRSAICGSVLT